MSKCLLIAVLVSLMLATHGVAAEPQPTPKPGQQVLQNGLGFDYWLYLPKEFDDKAELPLVIFLHGIGAKDMDEVKRDAPPARIDAGERPGYILVSPFWKNKWWSGEELIVLIDAMAAKYHVDRTRIYVTGLSMGGFATWDLACRYPDRFAGVVPICGGGKPDQAPAMKAIPVWAFHGALDRTVRLQESERMVEALRKSGAEPKFTIFPKAQHVCWPEVYSDPKMYEWLLSQKRSTPAAIDAYAEMKYAIRQGVSVRPSPIVTSSDTVGKQTTRLQLKNDSPIPVRVSGTLKAKGLTIQPATFSEELPAGGSRSLDVAIDGSGVATATAPPVQLDWTITAASDGTALTSTKSRSIPIAIDYECRPVIKPVEIDGDLADWTVPPVELRSLRVKNPPRGTDVTAPDAALYVAHDAEAIYVAVRVSDQRITTQADKPTWEQDAVEVRLDFRNPIPDGSFRDWDDFLPILLSPGKEGAAAAVWKPESLPQGVRYVCKVTTNGYVAEIVIPRKAIRQDWPLKQFRVNVAIDDRDEGTRVSQFWWHQDWRETDSSNGLGTFRVVN